MNHRLVLAGWIGFTISGILYLVSGIRSGDAFVIVGSVVWLLAVSLFLWVIARER